MIKKLKRIKLSLYRLLILFNEWGVIEPCFEFMIAANAAIILWSHYFGSLCMVISQARQSKCRASRSPLYRRVRGSGNCFPAGVFVQYPSI